jgi:hypothetical protein
MHDKDLRHIIPVGIRFQAQRFKVSPDPFVEENVSEGSEGV